MVGKTTKVCSMHHRDTNLPRARSTTTNASCKQGRYVASTHWLDRNPTCLGLDSHVADVHVVCSTHYVLIGAHAARMTTLAMQFPMYKVVSSAGFKRMRAHTRLHPLLP